MRPRIVALAAGVAASILMLAACNPGTSDTSASTAINHDHVSTSSSSAASPTPTPDNGVIIKPELTINEPVTIKDRQVVCSPNVQSARIVPDANGYGKAFDNFVTLTTNSGFLRIEWGKEANLVQAVIVNGKWGIVNKAKEPLHAATVMEFSDWGGPFDANQVVLCGWGMGSEQVSPVRWNGGYPKG